MPRKSTQLRRPKDHPTQQPPKRKSRKALDAFAIAESEIPTRLGVRRSRLGDDDDFSKRKRHPARDMDDDDDDSDGPNNKRRRTGDDSDFDENAGSDGEGHRWRLGEVDSDDDEELDSDEAMGSSDEERFDGFSFRGSSKSAPKKKKQPSKKSDRNISLSEDVEDGESEEGSDEDEDDLGEDAVDLLTAWDMNTAAEEEEKTEQAAKAKKQTSDDESEEYDSESEGEDDSDANEDDDDLSLPEDEADEHGLSKLQNFVNSMETASTKKSSRKTTGSHEHSAPTEFGLASTRKLTAADLLPSITDSRLKNSLKHVDSAVAAQKSSSGIPGKLDAPLAKRQQDKLDRAAAYEKSKETLDRWLDTVKANRRAEHLVFPLPDPNAQQSLRLGTVKPQNDLESTIQNILVESGLAEENGKDAEDQVQEFEELQARKLPLEEIRARRAELRKRRDLMFREEVRAKRIKKIKSKSYRRVHRREREKLEQQERQALLEAGVDPDEEEREANERRRAEARMGSKHKDSKWAKSLKQTGRTAWDEEARLGVADLALKEEELRKRIEGKRVTRGDDDYLGSSSSESEDENPWDEEAASDAEKRKLQKKLSKLEGGDEAKPEYSGPHAKLLSMKFMQNAEAARKAQNDAELRQLNRELHGEESQSEAESEVGRRKFGHTEGTKSSKEKAQTTSRNEFEEAPGSDDEENHARSADEDVNMVLNRPAEKKPAERSGAKSQGRRPNGDSKATEEPAEEENPWLVQTNRTNRRAQVDDSQQTVDIAVNDAKMPAPGHKGASSAQVAKPSTSSKKQHLEETSDSDGESVPVLLKNHDLVKRAFAGDEVVQDFEQEKQDTIREEDDQVIDNTLPGWGSWTGEGVSKKQQKRQKRFLTKVEGVKPQSRQDAKLSRVIINEKRIKKNNRYLATQLPHQFETKQQYERSLRMPLGPEWTTKETLQSATKPRVIMKQGIIKPMEKPMVYHTALEREGHQVQEPKASPTTGGPLNNFIHGILDGSDSLVNDLFDLGGDKDKDGEQSDPKPTSPAGNKPNTGDSGPVTQPAPKPTEPPKNTEPPKEPEPPKNTVPSKDTEDPKKPEPLKSTEPPKPTGATKPTHSSKAPADESESNNIHTKPTEAPTAPDNPERPQGGPTTAMANQQDVFVPVATGPIPQTISARNDHPVPKNHVRSDRPIETNKFYAGLYLGTQTNASFTMPYSLAWSKGTGNLQSWGMGISHVEMDKVALGPPEDNIPGKPVKYYVNPIGIQSMILSAQELQNQTVLNVENPLAFSANAVLQPRDGSRERITFPVLQGMGFVTGIYSGLQPNVESAVGYTKVVSAGSPRPGIFKYVASLIDGTTWLIYYTPQDGKDPGPRLESAHLLRGPLGWSGTIQVAKNPAGVSGEKLYDNSAGVYAVQGSVSGAVSDRTGTYQLAWAKDGKDPERTPLMMFALPHHLESFDNSTQGRATNITLRTTTKGMAAAVIGESWTFVEPDLPVDMGFAPWSTSEGSINKLSARAQKVLTDVAPTELKQDVNNQTDLNSMYYSGKAFSKIATLVYTVDKLGGNPQMAAQTLDDLKKALAKFVNNKQQFPLIYDNVWKGVVSSASYDGGDSGADFGNTLYNDHHFHYAYFIHAAAIIGALDPDWIQHNKDWVNMLVRDAGNSASNDPLFPFSRGFDWYHGHSWAKGLFESYDGKDQESTSEDMMFAYALKMWGKTVGDPSMEARGNLMLGVLRRSLRNYFLLEEENKNHPEKFVPNKVTGILFENKVDHTTYFGANLEYIHGIHMLPLMPASAYVRSRKFVKEEWEALFAPQAADPASKVGGGWKGVLYANLAIINPEESWKFFAQSDFNYTWIDQGASRTWYLAYAAGLGGAPS
ncbi:Utp14 protein-domain-containing protein [Aspergillus ambiguus]|uniref:Utp14 protein-domain-containing protein n=1 Tax=Aspergillus ambiguus TaxID=176160 RepID=UPI003CCD1012